MPKQLLQAQYPQAQFAPPQMAQPSYAAPQYLQPQYPHYQEPAAPFNSNLVAITGLGLIVGAVFLYFKNPFANLFGKNPEKDQDSPYANAAMRLYAALGRVQNNDETELYAVAQEIYTAMQTDAKFYANTKDWFERKYEKTLLKHFSDSGVKPKEQSAFFDIIAHGGYEKNINEVVQTDKGLIDKGLNVIGKGSETVTKKLATTYPKGEYLILLPKDTVGRKTRTSPVVTDGVAGGFGNNIAFTVDSSAYHIIGIATGNRYETEKNGSKTVFIEFLHKAKDKKNALAILKYFHAISKDYDVNLGLNGQIDALVKGHKLYIAESNLAKVGSGNTALLAKQMGLKEFPSFFAKPLAGLGTAVLY